MKLLGFKINKNKKAWLHIFPNLAILLMLTIFSFIAFTNQSAYVFSENSYDAIYYGNKNSNKVTLMFNVYWGSEYIPDILKTLEEYNVKTTFFVGGMWVEKEPEVLKSIFDAGHEIGNHGYFHKDMNKLSYDQNISEIQVCSKMVESTIETEMKLFAPPSGAFNTTTLKAAQSLGYKVIMWSKDTIDWRDKDENLVYSRATKNVAGGDLILMHPTEHTLKALPKILDYYKQNNFVATTVTDNLKV